MSRIASTALSATSALAAVGAATAAAAVLETRAFVLHEVTVPVLDPGTLGDGRDAFTILHISDLHMLAAQRLKQNWVAGLDALEPDLVVNTGDNLGEEQAVPAVLRALGPLLRRPGVFIFGSNDYFAPHPVNPFNYLLGKRNKPSDVELPWRGMRAAFVEHGWEDATHRRVDFATAGVKLAVGGVDDPHLDRDDYAALGGTPNPEADLAIGLSHSPEPRVLDEFAADGYQLMMSGHTHGGQLCLPGGRAVVTNCGIDRSRVSGLSRWSERMWLHVTNGLGTSKYVPFRTFCRPSATVLRVVERPS
ncbi:MAG: metallophosphoesterase [Corynebacterium sp.]|uniref:metallophosphoesterase n=1 Tax=unclassified Corynebacterium TaxID=2624378 RepID=UPI000964792B|nr:metallophosphoesterase [Corynebacterium sp. CNJ-954]OLT53734.1 metallophosphoesterase [Corynebacterium sp. CNJ-954]